MKVLSDRARIVCLTSLIVAGISFALWQDSIWAGVFFISAVISLEGIIH
jgi:hypothetical protein